MRAIDADALMDYLQIIPIDLGYREIDDVEKYVREMPTIEPERKKGKWIHLFDGRFTGGAYWFQCSKCKKIVPNVLNGGWNFCPNCGANMKSETEPYNVNVEEKA